MSDCRFGVSPVNYPDPDPDFLNFSNKCMFYKNKQKFAYFQHAFPSQLNVDTFFIVSE